MRTLILVLVAAAACVLGGAAPAHGGVARHPRHRPIIGLLDRGRDGAGAGLTLAPVAGADQDVAARG